MQLLIKNEINLETIVTVDNNTMPQREVNRNFLSSYTTLPSYNFFLGFNACRKNEMTTLQEKIIGEKYGKDYRRCKYIPSYFPLL